MEGGLVGFLANVMDVDTEADDADKGVASVGLFMDHDRNFEALVMRYEPGPFTFFGINNGVGNPVIHMQWIKGSEVERRRETLMRRKKNGIWVPNCPQGT